MIIKVLDDAGYLHKNHKVSSISSSIATEKIIFAFSLKITTNKKLFVHVKQVFYPDGTFKFKFGNKGTGNGEFDLPAGVAVDAQNRIVVVDKDNHRVQVFSCTGNFITKFGSYGKEIGQFMYPWAVASNYKTCLLII